jgi:putative tricarboxylic transport membrane protein
MSRVDRGVGIAALLGGILLAFAGWRLDPGTSKLPGPGFFPLLIACTMGGLGMWLLLRPGSEEKPVPPESSRWSALAIALISILGYTMVLNELGYLVSTFALLVVQLRWVEKQRWSTSLWTAAIASAVSLVVFRVLLKVPLPAGFFPLPKGW